VAFNAWVFSGIAALFVFLLRAAKRRRILAGCFIAILAVELGVVPVTLSATPLDNDSLPQEVLPAKLSSTGISFSSVSSCEGVSGGFAIKQRSTFVDQN